MAELKAWTRSIVATAGAAIAGPAGAIIGTFAGSIIAAILPGPRDFTNQVLSNLGRMSIDSLRKRIDDQFNPLEKQRVNHDLQTAFRQSLREAIMDIGGVECFPQLAEKPPRDVPAKVVFPLTATGRKLWFDKNPLREQVKDCVSHLDQAIADQRIFPLDPPVGKPSASVYSYLQAETPQALILALFNENFLPILKQFPTLLIEVPELETHLRGCLGERTLIHLGEQLKHNTPAWRAFNRLALEQMRAEIEQISSSQSEILERLTSLTTDSVANEGIGTWADQIANMLSALGGLPEQVEAGFDALSSQIVAQHQEVLEQLDELLKTSSRIEKKVDRVLRFMAGGKYVIEGDQPTLPMPKPPAPGEPPYKGLQNFLESDADLFFGRETWVARLVEHLSITRCLSVIGASGSGKSSIVRAGLVPVLRGTREIREVRQKPANCHSWPVWVMTPGPHPLMALASQIPSNRTPADILQFIQGISKNSELLDLAARQAASQAGAEHVLLVVDQLEEIFTQCEDESERAAFIQALMDASGPEPVGTVILILILRADYYGQCSGYSLLRQVIASHQEYIGSMSPAELKRAIEGPAALKGWHYETGVVDLMVKDAGQEPGALPLLSHALLETWRNRSGHTMTLESYAESGGVQGAIAKTADFIFEKRLTAEQQSISKEIFMRLTNLNENMLDTRRSCTMAELIHDPSQAKAIELVVQILSGSRLLTVEENRIEVSHEALIREWPRLRGWIEDNRAGLRIRHRLAESALEWQARDFHASFLLQGIRLEEAQEWAQKNLLGINELERHYLLASTEHNQRLAAEKEAARNREIENARRLAEAERRRAEEQSLASAQLRRRETFLRIALAGAAVLLLVAILLAALASNSSIQANQNASLAQAASTQAVQEAHVRATAETQALAQSRQTQVREISARALSLMSRDMDLALLLGAQAVKLSQTYQGTPSQDSGNALFQILNNTRYSQSLFGLEDVPLCVQFSPDGKIIAAAGRDQSIMLWNQEGQRVALLQGHSGPVNQVEFSPDGKMLLSASDDHTARLWSVTGQLIRVLSGHTAEVTAARFSPDGRAVLTTSNDGSVRLWNSETGQAILLSGHTGPVLTGTFSPDGQLVATAGADQVVRLWKIDGTPVKSFSGHESWIIKLSFSPDGKRLLSASWDQTARVWQVDSSQVVILNGHQSYLNDASFSPDGKLVVTAGADNLAVIWSADGKQIADLKGHTHQITSAVFSPDGSSLVTSAMDNTIRLWRPDGTALAVLVGHSGFSSNSAIRFSTDGKQLASTGSDLTVRLWNTNQWVSLLHGHYGAATTASFSADGRLILTGSTDGYIRFWRNDGLSVSQFYTQGPINHAGFSPDSKQILVALNKNKAVLYDLNSSLVQEYIGHEAKVLDAQFSHSGDLIVTASADKTARVWKKSGELVAVLKGHSAAVNTARFSQDDRFILTASDDKTARIWKLDGTEATPAFTHPDAVASAVYNPDGSKILTASWDNNAYLWASNGAAKTVLKGHTGPVIFADFSPDGRQIVTASLDATGRLWDADGKFFASLEGHSSWLTSAQYSADGTRLITTSWDGTARLWQAYRSISQLTADAVKRVSRPITPLECKTYLYMETCP